MALSYAQTFAESTSDPAAFWLRAATSIDWEREPATGLDASRAPINAWFPDGMLNVCHNALDRHVAAGRGDATALIYDSALLGIQERYSYAELLERVARFAGALRDQGIGTGDRVLIYLPMIPQAHIAMLACARLGAIHSVVFGGFAPKELAARIDDATPDVIITATGGIEPARRIEYLPAVAEAIAMAAHKIRTVIVAHRDGFEHSPAEFTGAGTAWHHWDYLTSTAEPAEAVPVPSTHPLYILYTSGTTGSPKGVVRDSGGYAVAMDWSMRNIYGVGPGSTMLTASDVGWVVGHSYIVYGPLIAGATTVLYEGKPVGTPDAGAFWRLIEDHQVDTFFTAPTALRAIRKADPEAALLAGHDISSLRNFFVAGERLDPDTYAWAREKLGVPVIDNWWQTETGWPIASNCVGLETLEPKAGSPTVPVPGYDVRILDGFGAELGPNQEGNIAIRLPLPPGTLATLWGNDARYIATYLEQFPGHYATGDSGYLDADGYLFVMGRTDDVINVSGHRLSTGAMEQVLGSHPAVAECAVIGVADELKGQRPSGYVVLKSGTRITEEQLRGELVSMVRAHIGPVADFREVRIVAALPKTRSGKILRKTMRQIADGKPYTVPSTIEDPGVIEDLLPFLRPAR
ncbi:propionyl-CoA synthetase [Paeniglutamicibacter psychrophenolicus]|uniref:Propionyl-CoA synthetase n=1 Tax=Paeniglutamicibacter psychrophenolicus TaxID=257454 RepID=A0ABS4WGW9_9MICC|nr:AMP-binding protein [Paeniglutamicibacter psychrophenolicus]MBP2375452.1 propionyl-CoA synthetase [Paeniglutamicibacter psychrophenolicus]